MNSLITVSAIGRGGGWGRICLLMIGNKSENKWNYIKLKSFFTAKRAIRTKRQATEWEKIFANDISNKRLISKIYKEFIKVNIRKLYAGPVVRTVLSLPRALV